MFAIELFLYGCRICFVFHLLLEVKIEDVSVALHMPC